MSSNAPHAVPVYAAVRGDGADYYYTTDLGEVNNLVASYGYTNGGVQFYGLDSNPNTFNDNAPVGTLDTADCSNGVVSGWALDDDDPNSQIQVHIYVNVRKRRPNLGRPLTAVTW